MDRRPESKTQSQTQSQSQRQHATFPPKDVPLRDDVRTLGALLGEVLKEQGGEALFARVEAARLAARRRRSGEAGAEKELVEGLRGLGAREATQVVRAFSAYFGLVNMAERVHRIRRRQDYLRRRTAQPGSLEAAVRALREGGVDQDGLRRLLSATEVVPVFTAHPTEAIRRTLLVKEQRFARALVDRIDPGRLLPQEEAAALARIRNEVTIAWQTEEHLQERPTVADEVEHVVFYLSEVVYRIVPAFYEALGDALRAVYGEGADRDLPCPVVRFASWVGGDMDGNPNVGADTIRATLARQRELVLRRYRGEVRALFDHLSQSAALAPVDAALAERAEAYAALLPEVRPQALERYRDMPYRRFLWLVSARLDATGVEAGRAGAGYASPADLEADLELVARSLLGGRGRNAGLFLVERLIRRLRTFGFHLATLDVRQHADVHRRALAGAGPDAERALEVMRAIAAARARYGPDAIGPYIVSMARGPDDVLAVLELARRAGFVEGATGAVPLDVAPLFETVDDLRHAAGTLSALLADPRYRAHVDGRGGRQVVMLGYSDSNKESGIAASRFALHDAEVALVRAADAAGARLTLFHGRGGTASRGGTKPRAAVLAEPPGAVRGRLRVTEQGEIIHAKYGLRAIALRTLELMTGAVLETTARDLHPAPGLAGAASPAGPPPEIAFAAVAADIARESRAAYRALVFDDRQFEAYFRAATPIDVIERLNIGSRPAKRTGQSGIEDLRAIPWVFAWTQSRHILPGWYGAGAALARAAERHGIDRLREMARAWPTFANLLSDVEMVLAKADMPIAARYAELAGKAGARIYPLVLAEFELTRRLVCDVQETRELLDRDAVLRRAIRLRNPYVDPMSLVQVELLGRWRAGGRKDPELEQALFATVRGIARGLQNTG